MNLVITRTNAEADQVFVYEVVSEKDGTKITVTIRGNGSVTIYDLPAGNYTVMEQGSWSWRCGSTSNLVTLDSQNDKVVTTTFDAGTQNTKWLNGNSEVKTNTHSGGTR